LKKFLIAISLAAASAFAAANPTGFINYDQASGDSKTLQKLLVGVAQSTSWGVLDFSVIHQRIESSSATGAEVGLTNGVKLGPVTLRGRLSLGYGSGETEDAGFYSVGAEAQVPVAQQVGLYANYLYRDAFGSSVDWSSSRASVGLDFAVGARTNLRVGYISAEQGDIRFNGGTVTVAYQF